MRLKLACRDNNLWIFMLFTLSALTIKGQTLSGRVVDGKDGGALPYANISIEGKSQGTVANRDGYFTMDLNGLSDQELVVFSYVGFENKRVALGDLSKRVQIALKPIVVNLDEVVVTDKELTARDIVERVEENYDKNYPILSQELTLFFHKYERTPFSKENDIKVKKSNFEGLSAQQIETLLAKLPDTFIEYNDAQLKWYQHDGVNKLSPIEAVSLEESSMESLTREMQELLGDFFDDMEKTINSEEEYFKMRSGIFAYKLQEPKHEDSLWTAQKKDSLHLLVNTNYVKMDINHLVEEYAQLKGKNWDFVTQRGKYTYHKEGVSVIDDEIVYVVRFEPKTKGEFEGHMYVTSGTFALVRADFSYRPGRETEKFDLLGIEHAMKYKEGHIVYEKGDGGYFLKYLSASQQEYAHIERPFSLMKKQKKFFVDKEISKVKVDLDMTFHSNTQWELLVMDRKPLTKENFKASKQPPFIRYRRVVAHEPEMWQNGTVIMPSAELKGYKRKAPESIN